MEDITIQAAVIHQAFKYGKPIFRRITKSAFYRKDCHLEFI